MKKKLLLKLLLTISTVMMFSVMYEVQLPFDKPATGGIFGGEIKFGMPHIAIQWILMLVIIAMVVDAVRYYCKEKGISLE